MGIIYKNGTYYGGGGGGATYTAGDGINIANDEISIDSMSSSDMSEVVYPLPTVGTKLPILFDETGEERQVGWYRYANGTKKPVYEQEFHINVKGSWQVTNLTTCEKIISCKSYVANNNNTIQTLTYYAGAGDYTSTGALLYNSNTLQLIFFATSNTYTDAYYTIQYTKTTDTPA